MSRYVIHKIPVDISDAKREDYIRYMKNIANNDSDTYFISLSKYQDYLICDTVNTAAPILFFKTIQLTEREFIKSINHNILQISYNKNDTGMFVEKINISPLLNGFSMSNEFAYYYFISNDEKQQIKIIEKSLVPLITYTWHIENTIQLRSKVHESEVAELKKLIQENERTMYHHMICNVIQNNCDIGKYEVDI
jgi:hypothetical protein|nr:MAG TPA: hypothetical protein [Caudoviricetes sp.]